MLPSPVRDATQDYIATTRGLTAQAVALILEIRGRTNSPERWRDAVASIGAELLALQVLIAGLADGYLDDVLDAQDAATAAEGAVAADAWMDYVDGGGSLLANLVFAPNSLRERGLEATYLRERMTTLSTTIVVTAMQDTGRSTVQASMQTRPAVRGYVRMLQPPSCARCAVLAGRRYRRAKAFDRHLNCDCRHIPVAEDSDDWTTNPKTYFRSLSVPEQDRVFTEAGARAIRDGADISQVVNAEKGVSVVSAYGREVLRTLEGTTRRGIAGQRLQAEGFAKTTGLKSQRYAHSRTPRLMPDEIYRLADELGWDRAETLRQLRRFAYIL
jgi:hypothetical protein